MAGSRRRGPARRWRRAGRLPGATHRHGFSPRINGHGCIATMRERQSAITPRFPARPRRCAPRRHRRTLAASLNFQGISMGWNPSEAASRPVLACVDSPHPLSGGMPRMRAAPAVILAGRMIRKSGPGSRDDRLFRTIMLEPRELQREYPRNGQCCRRRRPMGRRGEGQDRRLVVGAGRHRRALPGRPQCRPHAGHQRRNLQAGAAAVGRAAALEAGGDRQWRGVRSAGVPRRSRQTAGRRASPSARKICASPKTSR